MTLFTNTPQITGLFVFQPYSEQGFQAVVQQSAMLLHGKVA